MSSPCQMLLPILAILAFLAISWSPITTKTANRAEAAKILGLFAHPSESNFAVMRSIMTELAHRGHNITVYSSHRLNEKVENLEEIVVEPEFQFWLELQKMSGIKTPNDGLHALSQLPEDSLQKSLASVGSKAVDYFLTHAAVRELLQRPSESFDYDLIIVDLFYSEALLALGHYHQRPTIGIVSTNFENYMNHLVESFVPVACSPIDYETDQTVIGVGGYWQRLSVIRQCIERRKLYSKQNLGQQEKLIKKHFQHFAANAPTSAELRSELAVLLLNNHVPLMRPRPLLPNIIPAGGLHIHKPRELTWHIRRFMEEARHGVIYMHLGNEQPCSTIPQLRTFFGVFAQRREHVLWTCHSETKLEGMPKNVMLQHAVPQSDILAHPHVKAFIMNGDLLSLQEGIVRHLPLIGIPIFRNEQNNMDLAVRLDVGIKLNYANLSEASLNDAIDAAIHSTVFPLSLRRVATEFRDRPLGSVETSMYWVDYVLRQNGGIAIKTPGIGIASSHLHLFDLFVFYFLMATLGVAVLVGIYFVGVTVWKRQQIEKLYSKLS